MLSGFGTLMHCIFMRGVDVVATDFPLASAEIRGGEFCDLTTPGILVFLVTVANGEPLLRGVMSSS